MWLKFNKIVSNIHSLEASVVSVSFRGVAIAHFSSFGSPWEKNDKCPSNARCRKSVGQGWGVTAAAVTLGMD